MNDNIGSLHDSFQTYFEVTIPLAVVVLLVARWSSDVVRATMRLVARLFASLARVYHRSRVIMYRRNMRKEENRP